MEVAGLVKVVEKSVVEAMLVVPDVANIEAKLVIGGDGVFVGRLCSDCAPGCVTGVDLKDVVKALDLYSDGVEVWEDGACMGCVDHCNRGRGVLLELLGDWPGCIREPEGGVG